MNAVTHMYEISKELIYALMKAEDYVWSEWGHCTNGMEEISDREKELAQLRHRLDTLYQSIIKGE